MAFDVGLSPDFRTVLAIVAQPDTKLELVSDKRRFEVLYLNAFATGLHEIPQACHVEFSVSCYTFMAVFLNLANGLPDRQTIGKDAFGSFGLRSKKPNDPMVKPVVFPTQLWDF